VWCGKSKRLLFALNLVKWTLGRTRKFEIRSTKYETISKPVVRLSNPFKCPNDQNVSNPSASLGTGFEFLSFEFVSSFGFRYSSLFTI